LDHRRAFGSGLTKSNDHIRNKKEGCWTPLSILSLRVIQAKIAHSHGIPHPGYANVALFSARAFKPNLAIAMSYVLQMIEEGEHQTQDFKMRVDNARKIAKTIVAFANSEGGRLLIGVKDNGGIVGVQADEEVHVIDLACQSHCKPTVAFEAQVWKAEGRSVLEIKVPRSPARPHFCEDEEGKWRAYLRQEDRIHRASPVQVKVWQYEMRMDRSEFRYDQYIGKLFAAWRNGRKLAFRQVVRMGRLSFADAEDLLCLLVVWGIVAWQRGPKGLTYALTDAGALDELETHGPESFRWKNYS
jgi:predicted HTH transcriptional regulator